MPWYDLPLSAEETVVNQKTVSFDLAAMIKGLFPEKGLFRTAREIAEILTDEIKERAEKDSIKLTDFNDFEKEIEWKRLSHALNGLTERQTDGFRGKFQVVNSSGEDESVSLELAFVRVE